MKKIYLATGNKDKVNEVSKILNIPIEFVKIDLDEVQSMDLEYVARRKAEAAFKILKKPVIIDDVGVFLDAWNQFPGPFVKFMNDLLGYEKIISLFKNEKNRKLVVQCVIAYHDGKKVNLFVGSVKGNLAEKKRGTNGWGFDPLVIPDGYSQTFAEMGSDMKNQISHRAKALKKFKKYLDSQRKQKEI